MLQAILSWSHVEAPMESIVKGLSRGKPAVESDFFDSVIGEFGIHQSLCYFVAANLANELVEIDARLGGDGSTDGTVVATNLLGDVAC